MPLAVRHSRSLFWMSATVCCCLFIVGGCGPVVMLSKMLQGDPLIPDDFSKFSGKALAKSGKLVAILCSTPESIKSEYASLDIDLLSEISRKLAMRDISVVKDHKVATWIDDHESTNLDLKELGNDTDADYVVQVKVDDFDFREENSPNLFRGRANGAVTVYELKRETPSKSKAKGKTAAGFLKADGKVQDKIKGKDTDTGKDTDSEKDTAENKDPKKDKDSKTTDSDKGSSKKSKKDKKDKSETKRDPVTSVRQVYSRSFHNVYPVHQPVSIEQMQPETFKKKFIDHVSDDLAKLFYAHKAGSGF